MKLHGFNALILCEQGVRNLFLLVVSAKRPSTGETALTPGTGTTMHKSGHTAHRLVLGFALTCMLRHATTNLQSWLCSHPLRDQSDALRSSLVLPPWQLKEQSGPPHPVRLRCTRLLAATLALEHVLVLLPAQRRSKA